MDPVLASPPVLRSVAAVGSSGRPRAVLRGVVARSGAALHGASRLSAAAAAEMRTGMRTRCCAKERWQGAAPWWRGAEAGCAQRAVEQGSSGRPRGGVAWRVVEQRSGGGEQWPAARGTQRSVGWEQPRTLQFCYSSHYQPACKMFGRMLHKILGAKVQAEMV